MIGKVVGKSALMLFTSCCNVRAHMVEIGFYRFHDKARLTLYIFYYVLKVFYCSFFVAH